MGPENATNFTESNYKATKIIMVKKQPTTVYIKNESPIKILGSKKAHPSVHIPLNCSLADTHNQHPGRHVMTNISLTETTTSKTGAIRDGSGKRTYRVGTTNQPTSGGSLSTVHIHKCAGPGPARRRWARGGPSGRWRRSHGGRASCALFVEYAR